mmetsp:Transcript_87262/g.251986  ORF Transcript_87262/g.251986 Transcript_87262/m.251986 type:complete len:124 (-) Transcript_87262:80-451(-)
MVIAFMEHNKLVWKLEPFLQPIHGDIPAVVFCNMKHAFSCRAQGHPIGSNEGVSFGRMHERIIWIQFHIVGLASSRHLDRIIAEADGKLALEPIQSYWKFLETTDRRHAALYFFTISCVMLLL